MWCTYLEPVQSCKNKSGNGFMCMCVRNWERESVCESTKERETETETETETERDRDRERQREREFVLKPKKQFICLRCILKCQ